VTPALPSGRRVAPSILSADFARLGDQVAAVMEAGARVIHVDVMDGHFVPPITIGALIVQSLRDQVHEAGGWLDVHLMVDRPERHVAAFAEAGADSINIHQEATPHVNYALNQVKDAGCRAGLAINPSTPVEMLREVTDVVDIVLCMTVNPGWGGQPFISSSLQKVARLRDLLPDTVAVTVDGGVDTKTAPACAEAGATLFVAGSAVFGTEDPTAAYRALAAVVDDA
jgi:ribulose-phosphate 3-epimerase